MKEGEEFFLNIVLHGETRYWVFKTRKVTLKKEESMNKKEWLDITKMREK